MKKPELYKKTVDILYNAYFNDTLQHANCWACSTGNIIAANNNLTIEINPVKENSGIWLNENNDAVPVFWSNVFCTEIKQNFFGRYVVQKIDLAQYHTEAAQQIKSTGYTPVQLANMEYAFESAKIGKSAAEYMFNGLVAVLEVLKEIHEVEDNTQEVTKFKNHFTKLQTL